MRVLWSVFVGLVLALVLAAPGVAAECKAVYGSGGVELKVATGSPGELGLVRELAEVFLKDKDARVCWVKAGSGKSLKLLKANKVDAVMVHAPAAEKKAVTEGWALDRTLIGMNEFYLVGPKGDPAGVGGAKSVADAYARIAKAQSLFLSRGDNSGTHKKEMAIWKKAGVAPAGEWYQITKDFMLASLLKADAEGGHFMTDSSTYVVAKRKLKDSKILFQGDPFIINTYHALAGAKSKHKAMARGFVAFLGAPGGQKVIRTYGKAKYGLPLYKDAKAAIKYDH